MAWPCPLVQELCVTDKETLNGQHMGTSQSSEQGMIYWENCNHSSGQLKFEKEILKSWLKIRNSYDCLTQSEYYSHSSQEARIYPSLHQNSIYLIHYKHWKDSVLDWIQFPSRTNFDHTYKKPHQPFCLLPLVIKHLD